MRAEKFSDVLTREEIASLKRRSDVAGAWTLLFNWGLIAGAFAAAIAWPNPLTVVGAILIIGGRQLGIGIIMHDCAHRALFRTRWPNELFGHWLGAVPMGGSLALYRSYHLKHHRDAGTPDDPDRVFIRDYPVARASLKRKFARDLTGRTGVRDLKMQLAQFRLRRDWPWLAFHVCLFGALALAGAPWAYALWWAAQLIVYPFIMRLRQIGEHGVAPNRDDPDPRRNTSTTVARWWERLLVAPNHVHWHLEHHLAPGFPSHRLGRMHELLVQRGLYEGFDCVSDGYVDVVRRAVRA
jgi:fatty acid desaturase